MNETAETESQSLSPDEDIEDDNSPSKNTMEIDQDETQTEDESDTNDTNNKENKNKSSNNSKSTSKKRKNTSPDTDNNPKKKRKINNNNKNNKKYTIRIGSDSIECNISILNKIPYFESRISDISENNNTYKLKAKDIKFTINDFKHLKQFISTQDLEHITEISDLEGLCFCCQKFDYDLEYDEIESIYNAMNDENNIYKKWKNSRAKILVKLYKNITKNDNTKETKKKKKRRPTRSKHRSTDEEGDIQMTEEDKESKRIEKKEKAKKRAAKVAKKLHDSILPHFQLSNDENDSDSDNNNNNKLKEKSKRLLNQSEAFMTQQYNSDNNNDDSDDEENEAKQREKNIKHLNDISNINEMRDLQMSTIHRLCRTHKINIRKSLNKKEKKEKEEFENNEKNKNKIWRGPKNGYRNIENKELIKKLKKEKKIIDGEININSLEDVNDIEYIGDYRRDTLVRLCKKHRIPANQKLINMIKCLEERYENRSDEDDYIETLKDVNIDDIKNLPREVLIRLCNKHNVETVRRKKKKNKKKKRKKKSDDSDSDNESDNDSDNDSDENEDIEDDELIKELETIKQKMNESKVKKQKVFVCRLEQATENMLSIGGFRNNYLTISGDKDFKDKCQSLIALCNSESKNKSLNYDVVDDVLDPYKVCISENGARTIKVMMCIARGGCIVTDKWISHSIKAKKWRNPQHYESEWGNWKSASENSRDCQKGLLFSYSIYIQDRPSKLKPSSLQLKHLAWNCGARIVNNKWNTERLKKKEIDDGLEDSDSDNNNNNKNKNKKKKKKSKRRTKKKSKRRTKKKHDSDNDMVDTDDDNDNDNEEKEESESDNNSDNDNDIDMNDKNKNKKKKKKGKKKEKISASKSRKNILDKHENDNSDSSGNDNDSDYDDDDNDENVSNKKKKKGHIKLIISHPSIYKDLKIKKDKNIKIVGQKWLFQSIEEFKVENVSGYIVKPNKNQSRSPAH